MPPSPDLRWRVGSIRFHVMQRSILLSCSGKSISVPFFYSYHIRQLLLHWHNFQLTLVYIHYHITRHSQYSRMALSYVSEHSCIQIPAMTLVSFPLLSHPLIRTQNRDKEQQTDHAW